MERLKKTPKNVKNCYFIQIYPFPTWLHGIEQNRAEPREFLLLNGGILVRCWQRAIFTESLFLVRLRRSNPLKVFQVSEVITLGKD